MLKCFYFYCKVAIFYISMEKLHSHFCSFSRMQNCTLSTQVSTECNRSHQVMLTTKQKYVLKVLLNNPFFSLNKTHKTSLLLLLLSMLSLLCRVFTIIYLKQTMFLGYIVLQLICIYNLCYRKCFFALKYVLYFENTTSRRICAVPHMAFFVVP